ncbi:class I SAM-dependent methyltransferase [Sulfurimonas sp. HSL3-7]|uniref:class I SAM-dependent methyltransferase n=1 Tax=Sulfonitrofixus jiaomeiensis TaxID=3131938 RepID=UPI0031F93140
MSIQKMWNEKFSREGFLYGKEPNAFLASNKTLFSPESTILMLGEGEGRTACYMASKGFRVSALDASDVGLEKTRALADEMGVKVETIHADLDTWRSREKYRGVLTSFLHLPDPLRTEAFSHAVDILENGGYFVGEFFSLKQLSRDSGGPKMAELLYTLESLEKIFSRDDVKIIRLEACVDYLCEGSGHQGDAELIRIIAQKI